MTGWIDAADTQRQEFNINGLMFLFKRYKLYVLFNSKKEHHDIIRTKQHGHCHCT